MKEWFYGCDVVKLKEKIRVVNDMVDLLGVELRTYQKVWLCIITNSKDIKAFDNVNKMIKNKKRNTKQV